MPLPRPQLFTDAQWVRQSSWMRYLPLHPRASFVSAMRLSPLWLWSMLVATAVAVYATLAEVSGQRSRAALGRGGSCRRGGQRQSASAVC